MRPTAPRGLTPRSGARARPVRMGYVRQSLEYPCMIDLHPAIVHLPLGLAVVLPFVILVLANHTRWGWPRSAFAIAVALQAVLFIGALVALRTGEGAEERVENRVPDAALETHEHQANAFTWTAGGVLLLLLAG